MLVEQQYVTLFAVGKRIIVLRRMNSILQPPVKTDFATRAIFALRVLLQGSSTTRRGNVDRQLSKVIHFTRTMTPVKTGIINLHVYITLLRNKRYNIH